MNEYVSLLIGVACAGIGGELLVRGTVGLARWARVSPGIVGVTVTAFATSSPELSVSVSASLAGRPQIALGDALGSNVVNVALILSLSLLIAAVHTPRFAVRRDFPVAVLAPITTAGLLIDGVLSRIDGLLLLAMFLAWFVAATLEARRQRSGAERIAGVLPGWVAVALGAVGLALLVVAGQLIVAGSWRVAASFGVDEFVIGATVVAIGTSVPELATTVVAMWRGYAEVALGTILGSNIFNGLFIVAIAAILAPISVDRREVDVALAFGLAAVALTFPTREGVVGRARGGLLLLVYAAYLAAVLGGR